MHVMLRQPHNMDCTVQESAPPSRPPSRGHAEPGNAPAAAAAGMATPAAMPAHATTNPSPLMHVQQQLQSRNHVVQTAGTAHALPAPNLANAEAPASALPRPQAAPSAATGPPKALAAALPTVSAAAPPAAPLNDIAPAYALGAVTAHVQEQKQPGPEPGRGLNGAVAALLTQNRSGSGSVVRTQATSIPRGPSAVGEAPHVARSPQPVHIGPPNVSSGANHAGHIQHHAPHAQPPFEGSGHVAQVGQALQKAGSNMHVHCHPVGHLGHTAQQASDAHRAEGSRANRDRDGSLRCGFASHNTG
jgi:hypothetical protein